MPAGDCGRGALAVLQRASGRPQSGFTYLWILFAIAMLGVSLTVSSQLWVSSAQRQKIEQMNWIAEQFKQAIGSYYESSPGSVKLYPQTPEMLLQDERFITTKRHLRKIYANPFSGLPDWDWIRGVDGGLRGVRVHGNEGTTVKEFVYEPRFNLIRGSE